MSAPPPTTAPAEVFSEPYFLGLDASTQSLKASLLSLDLDVIAECAVNFDADLPHYGTRGGVLKGQGGEVWSPVGMLVEALDVLFGRIKEKGWALGKVGGVACSGQVSLGCGMGAGPAVRAREAEIMRRIGLGARSSNDRDRS